MLTKRPLEFEQRRAGLERTAASLVHAVAGALNVIGGRATLLALKSTDPTVRETVDAIQAQVQKLSAHLKEVRAFAESIDQIFEEVSLPGIASSAAEHAVAVSGDRSVRFALGRCEGVCQLPVESFALALSNLFAYAACGALEGSTIDASLVVDENARRSEHAPEVTTVVAKLVFALEPNLVPPLSQRARCEPWFEEGPRNAKLGLLWAASCGVVHDRGGWSSATFTSGVLELSAFWPLAA